MSWSLIERQDIYTYEYFFLRIENNVIVTASANFTVNGPVKNLTSLRNDTLAVGLNGVDQFINMSSLDRNSCLWNLENCTLGLRLSFDLKVLELKENMYIFTSGGDDINNYGVAIYYRQGQYYVTVSTSSMEWTVYTELIHLSVAIKVEISWSVQFGLSLYLDDNKVAHTTEFIYRNVMKRLSYSMYIGCSSSLTVYSNIIIANWKLVTACREIDVSVPALTIPTIPSLELQMQNSTVTFNCSFTQIEQKQTESYEYILKWYNTNSVISTSTFGNRTFDIITESQLTGLEYGHEIYCGVSACIQGDCNNTIGPERTSLKFKAELKIKEEKVIIIEGQGSSAVTVISTLPPHMFCLRNQSDCDLLINTYFIDNGRNLKCLDNRRLPQALVVTAENNTLQCGSKMTSESWQEGFRVSVLAGLDGLIDNMQTLHLNVSVTLNKNNYLVGTVTVEVMDSDIIAECKVVGDPHITAFDGRKYDNYLEGPFVLVRDKQKQFEVIGYLRRCTDVHDYASCVCAVAVRSGDDVLVFDKCGASRGVPGRIHPLTIQAYLNGNLTDDTSIFRLQNNKFKVSLPSGMAVTISTTRGLKNKYLNVFITSSAKDYNNLEGLCEKNTTQLDVVEYEKRWRSESDIYVGFCGALPLSAPSDEIYCDCPLSGSLGCRKNPAMFACSKQQTGLKTVKDVTNDVINSKTTQRPPKKCLTTQTIGQFEFDRTYQVQIQTIDNTAKNACRVAIEESAIFKSCKILLGEEVNEIIDDCAKDYQLSNYTTAWDASALVTITHRCQTIIQIKTELWVNISGPPQNLLDVLACPNNCSGRGICYQDGCNCSVGYIGDDCSQNYHVPPTVYDSTNYLCDLRLSDCKSVTVVGDGFVQTVDLSCYIQQMEMVNSTFVVKANSFLEKVSVTYISSEQVICALPTAGIYTVVVSNVGNVTIISSSIIYVTYDSVCYNCNSSSCDVKPNSCMRYGKCFGINFVNESNPQEICSGKGNTSWSLIERQDIYTYVYFFLTIENNVIVTTSGNFTVNGSVKNLTSLRNDTLAVGLNGVDQFINMSSLDRNSCLWNPENCTLGLRLSFDLKVLELKENMYIFTSGGDDINNYGVAIYYKQGQYYVTVSTSSMEWTVYTELIHLSVAIKVEISWSVQFGLSLYLDDNKVAHTTEFIYRNVMKRLSYSMYIGCSSTLTVYSNIIIANWKLVTACREIDLSVPALTSTIPPTTIVATTVATSNMTVETVTSTNITTLPPTNVTSNFTTLPPTNVTSNVTSGPSNGTTQVPTNVTSNVTSGPSSATTQVPTNVTSNVTSGPSNATTQVPTNVTSNVTSGPSSATTQVPTNVTSNVTSETAPTTVVTPPTNVSVSSTTTVTGGIVTNATVPPNATAVTPQSTASPSLNTTSPLVTNGSVVTNATIPPNVTAVTPQSTASPSLNTTSSPTNGSTVTVSDTSSTTARSETVTNATVSQNVTSVLPQSTVTSLSSTSSVTNGTSITNATISSSITVTPLSTAMPSSNTTSPSVTNGTTVTSPDTVTLINQTSSSTPITAKTTDSTIGTNLTQNATQNFFTTGQTAYLYNTTQTSIVSPIISSTIITSGSPVSTASVSQIATTTSITLNISNTTASSVTTSISSNTTTPSVTQSISNTTASSVTSQASNTTTSTVTQSISNTTASYVTSQAINTTTPTVTQSISNTTASSVTASISSNATTPTVTQSISNTTSSSDSTSQGSNATTPTVTQSISNTTASSVTASISSNATTPTVTQSISNTTASSVTTSISSNATTPTVTQSISNTTSSSDTTSQISNATTPTVTQSISNTTASSVTASISSIATTPTVTQSISNTTASSVTTSISEPSVTSPTTTPQSNSTTIAQVVSNTTVQGGVISTAGSSSTFGNTLTTGSTGSSTGCIGPIDSYPIMKGPPEITFLVSSNNPYFDCDGKPADNETEPETVEYNVKMISGQVILASCPKLSCRLQVSDLTQEQKTSIITSGLSCLVMANNPKRCGNKKSPELSYTLDPFTIQAKTPSLEIDESESSRNITVSISSSKTISVDLYCILKYGVLCSVTLQTRITQKSKCFDGKEIPLMVVKSPGSSKTCGNNLTSLVSSVDLEIHIVKDRIIREPQNVTIQVIQVDLYSNGKKETILNKFTFTIKNRDLNGLCKIVGDPHVFSFDKTNYDCMSQGEFVLFSHTKLPVQINGYFYFTGSGSSACGFSIRSGDDVIRVSKCDSVNSQSHPVIVSLFLIGSLTPRTVVYQSEGGDTVKILLPTGTVAEIKSSVEASMSIFIRPSAADIGKTEGLCGLYDGNKRNDLRGKNGILYNVSDDGLDEPNDFSKSWSVTSTDSLYTGYQGSPINFDFGTFCYCSESGETYCPELGDVAACDLVDQGVDITDYLIRDLQYNLVRTSQTPTTGRKRREALSWAYQESPNKTLSTIYDEMQALQLCKDKVIHMPAYNICGNYSNNNIDSDIQACAKDVMLTNSSIWADALAQNLLKSCLAVIVSTPDLWNTKIENLLCLNNCSGQGTCSNGICSCTAAYTGKDCSIRTDMPPTVYDVKYLCAMNDKNCSSAIILGDNFAEDAVCELTPVNAFSLNLPSYGSKLTVSATYRSKYLILCNLTDTQSYSVRVRNGNRSGLSNNAAYYIQYKSTCALCKENQTPICTFLENTCQITGACYANGEKNPLDSRQICNTSISSNSWVYSTSDLTTSNPRVDNSDSVEFNSKTVIIVTGCIAGILLIVVIVVAVIIAYRRQKMRRSLNKLNSSSSDEDSVYQRERIYDGSQGLRTDRNLMFYNPSLAPSSYDHFENSA